MEVARLVQDDHATVDAVVGCHIKAFICIFSYDDDTGKPYPIVFLFETRENSNWHRIFLEAGICFWDLYGEFPDHEVEYEQDLFPTCEFVKGTNLEGSEILSATVNPYRQGCKVEIIFSGGVTFEASISTCTNEDGAVSTLGGKLITLEGAEQGAPSKTDSPLPES